MKKKNLNFFSIVVRILIQIKIKRSATLLDKIVNLCINMICCYRNQWSKKILLPPSVKA